MSKLTTVLLALSAFVASAAFAYESADEQRPAPITRIYISPGASGSIGTSSRYERYDNYGGYRVPSGGYRNERSFQGSGSSQTRGNVIQSIEYLGIGEFQDQPGSRTIEINRR
ncbi:hypothetical protein D3879_15610 [Pseudomonas cavernicola]|uniref:Uncharacterized protein n=1 Tax=Pseudomonas cavernicola TaxID=2320866 RepID=A0A418XEY4_9PSED|nr:hypothetical protein [Pseudomonas cavernicola]RJG11092.1 hypothetical protein D3879_15610 [Pseudomonas cavernicola]